MRFIRFEFKLLAWVLALSSANLVSAQCFVDQKEPCWLAWYLYSMDQSAFTCASGECLPPHLSGGSPDSCGS